MRHALHTDDTKVRPHGGCEPFDVRSVARCDVSRSVDGERHHAGVDHVAFPGVTQDATRLVSGDFAKCDHVAAAQEPSELHLSS